MEGAATGVLDIYMPNSKPQTFMWNGNAEDQALARSAFERTLATGHYLAHVTESPGKARQVSSWSEVEKTEKEQGAVSVQLTPQIAGGAS
jgi:hypothetical protein